MRELETVLGAVLIMVSVVLLQFIPGEAIQGVILLFIVGIGVAVICIIYGLIG